MPIDFDDQINLRVPAALKERIEAQARRRSQKTTEYVRAALVARLEVEEMRTGPQVLAAEGAGGGTYQQEEGR